MTGGIPSSFVCVNMVGNVLEKRTWLRSHSSKGIGVCARCIHTSGADPQTSEFCAQDDSSKATIPYRTDVRDISGIELNGEPESSRKQPLVIERSWSSPLTFCLSLNCSRWWNILLIDSMINFLLFSLGNTISNSRRVKAGPSSPELMIA